MTEPTALQKAGLCLEPFLPGPIASSPMIALLNSAPLKGVAPGAEQASSERYMSVMRSIYQLYQYKMACMAGLFPFHETFSVSKLHAAHERYTVYKQRAEDAHNARLDAFYAAAKQKTRDAALDEFLAMMEDYAVCYVRLLEYYLYTCLVEPHLSLAAGPAARLQDILTPRIFPHLSDCGTIDQKQAIIKDMIEFFAEKQRVRTEQEAANRAAGLANPDCASHLSPVVVATEGRDTYKGYLPRQTALEYMYYMDVDGVLSRE